jgi:hypothetical protein
MTIIHPNPVRDAILNRIGEKASHIERPAGAPLTWDDIGLLCQGLVFAQRPIMAATRDVTERNSLGPRGAWLLNLISAGVNFPHELSEVMGIGRSLMSAELVRLTDAGLIISKPGATDKRRTERRNRTNPARRSGKLYTRRGPAVHPHAARHARKRAGVKTVAHTFTTGLL